MIKERGFTMQLKKRLDNMVMFFEYLLMKNDFIWCLWMFITLFLHITIFLFLSPAILLFIAYSAILYGILKYNNEIVLLIKSIILFFVHYGFYQCRGSLPINTKYIINNRKTKI